MGVKGYLLICITDLFSLSLKSSPVPCALVNFPCGEATTVSIIPSGGIPLNGQSSVYSRVPFWYTRSMQLPKKRLFFRYAINLCLIGIAFWGGARLYFELTDGFSIANIRSNGTDDVYVQLPALNQEERLRIEAIFKQPFRYFGKGCQSYAFVSNDGHYVLKFLKYKHFHRDPWVRWLTFIPPVEQYQRHKMAQKKEKLEKLLGSWKIAYEQMPQETGVIYVHLKNSQQLQQEAVIIDKLGIAHPLNVNQYEFLLQKRANLLCPTLNQMMADRREQEAKELIDKLLAMLVSEHQLGVIDHDYALMQNTGVLEGCPLHIDVGQFECDEQLKEPEMAVQQLFDQTYKFRLWLQKYYPELRRHLDERLYQFMGDALYQLTPRPKVKA